MLGEVRRHTKNGLYYIYEFHPDSERKAWLRLDTFIWGKWRDYPKRTTTTAMLIRLTSAQQKAAIRKYRRSERSIETTSNNHSSRNSKPSRKSSRKRPSRKRPSKKCNSYSFSRCPVKRCTSVKGSRTRRSYCRERN